MNGMEDREDQQEMFLFSLLDEGFGEIQTVFGKKFFLLPYDQAVVLIPLCILAILSFK